MSNDYEKTVDTLMKDIKELRADMKDIMSALHKKAGYYVDSTKKSLHDSVTQRPVVSLLATLGVGVVLGGLLQRRRR